MLIYGRESAADNFARGFYSVGKEIIEPVLERLRKLSENCSNLQGFMISHSFGGGTGSGFTAQLMDELSNEYGKSKSKQGIKSLVSKRLLLFKEFGASFYLHSYKKIQFVIGPSPDTSNSVVEPYNNLLGISSIMNTTDCVFMFDNEALYDICYRHLFIEKPNYNSLNRLVAQVKVESYFKFCKLYSGHFINNGFITIQ